MVVAPGEPHLQSGIMRSRLLHGPVRIPAPVRTVLTASTASAVLLLAGCGSSGSAAGSSGSPSPSASASAPASAGTTASASASASAAPAVTTSRIDDVTVTGAKDGLPTLAFKPPFGVAQTAVKTLRPGTGPVVRQDQLAKVNYTGVNGSTGKAFDSSVDPQFRHVGPASFQLTTGQLVPGFIKGLVGQHVGSRVLIAIPPADGYGAQGSAQAGIKGTDTLLFVVDIDGAQTPLTKATGTAVTPAPTLPKVTLTNGVPTAIAKPTGAAPKKAVTQVLVRGTGPKIAKGQNVSLQAVAEVWRTGKLVTDTWKSGGAQSIAVGTGQLIPAADAALIGQPVGSRVMVVVPPPVTSSPTADVTATDSIVFVFDLLAAS